MTTEYHFHANQTISDRLKVFLRHKILLAIKLIYLNSVGPKRPKIYTDEHYDVGYQR